MNTAKCFALLALVCAAKLATGRALLSDVCTGAGNFPVPDKVCVAEYWSCNEAGASPIPMPCAAGTVFNADTGNCDFASNVKGCPYDATKCPSAGLWPVTPFECSENFFNCAGTGVEPSIQPCASGTVFNAMLGNCDFPENTISCNEECPTPTYALKAVPNFSYLNAAVESANLSAALNDPNLVATIFVPTNAAFVDLVNGLGISLEQLLSPDLSEVVSKVLLTHVVPGVAANSTELFNGQVLPTLNSNQTLTVELGDSVMIKPEGGAAAKVESADFSLCSSIAHTIASVLLPSNLED